MNFRKASLNKILECYSIILKNNQELLNKRLDQLKDRENNLKKKEFLLSTIKSNDYISNSSLNLNSDDNLKTNLNDNKILNESKIKKIF